VVTDVPLEEADNHATVEFDRDDRVTGFEYKPDEPTTPTVAAEIWVYDPTALIEVVEELHAELAAESEGGDSGLGDYGEHLLPRMVERGRTFAHRMPGYWRDLGQPHLYLAAHQDVLEDDSDIFGDPAWPFLSHQPQRMPARLEAAARVDRSLISPGAHVAGTVQSSVLGPGVRVEAGARVANSVVFADSTIEAGAQVDWTVIDSDCVIGANAVIGSPDANGTTASDEVTLIGKDCRVSKGTRVDAGGRLEPGTTI
jgi:glucose-1-phosphate adenylyltransferase